MLGIDYARGYLAYIRTIVISVKRAKTAFTALLYFNLRLPIRCKTTE